MLQASSYTIYVDIPAYGVGCRINRDGTLEGAQNESGNEQ